jgi:hypothetical protein
MDRDALDCERKFALDEDMLSVFEIGRVHNKTIG